MDEAFEQARVAIDQFCQVVIADGGVIPAARPIAEHQADPDDAGWIEGTNHNAVRLTSSLGLDANPWWVVSTEFDPQLRGNMKYLGNGTWKATTPPLVGVAVGPR